jgi:hypothetical protein
MVKVRKYSSIGGENNMFSSCFLFFTTTFLLMGVFWPEDVAGAQLHHHQSTGAYPSYNLNKNFNDNKYNNQHPHRHHHHIADRHQQQQQQVTPSTTTDYPEAAGDALDYENEDNSDHLSSSDNSFINDASADGSSSSGSSTAPLMGLLPEPGTYIPSNCTSCIQREELRRRNLEVIKDQILSKLGMQRAPNMTGRLPPRIPPLDHLLDLYGMQGDAPPGHGRGSHGSHHHHQQSDQAFQTGPVYDEEEDDFHARTEKVIAFSQHCKSLHTVHIHSY